MDKIWSDTKRSFAKFFKLFVWLMPLAIFLIAIALVPYLLWQPNFQNYLELLRILVWPLTVLVILFFFREVATYLFFSMDEFNFFGAKGDLKNVHEVILEGVNKKLQEEKNEERRRIDTEEMKERIRTQETQLTTTAETSAENLQLAKDIFKKYKDSEKQNQKIISDLETENRRIRDILSGFSSSPKVIIPETSSATNEAIGDGATSDPVREETNTTNT